MKKLVTEQVRWLLKKTRSSAAMNPESCCTRGKSMWCYKLLCPQSA